MRKRFWKGLRTIEIGIVFAIICIVLAVIAVRYPDFKCRSMQSEAKFSLQEVHSAQLRYHSEYDTYAPVSQLVDVDKRVVLPNKYYRLTDKIEPSKDRFVAIAKGEPGTAVAGEVWSINEFKEIRLDKAVCKN